MTALRRFIFRYLLSDKFQLDPSQSATGHFKDPSLWPMETDARSANSCDESSNILTERARKYLPPELIVGRVYTLMKHYCNIIKVMYQLNNLQTRTFLNYQYTIDYYYYYFYYYYNYYYYYYYYNYYYYYYYYYTTATTTTTTILQIE